MEAVASVETNRGDVLSGFHEAVRDFSREARLVFTLDGVKLYGRDNTCTVMVQYNLPITDICANGQGKYKCNTESVEVGIDTRIVANCLSSVACGDLVGIAIDMENEPDKLVIKCQNLLSGKRSCYKVTIPEIPECSVVYNSLKDCDYNSEIIMSSLLFHDMLRDLSKSDAASVRVCCDGTRLVMVANGRHIKAAFEVRVGSNASHFAYTAQKGDKWPVCESFSASFLQKVAKAKTVATNISIYLKPNFPIAFAYKSPIGTLSFMISMRDDDEWIENPESRIMPTSSDDIDGIVPRQRSNCGKKHQDISGREGSSTIKKEVIKREREEEEEAVDDDISDDSFKDTLHKKRRVTTL